MREIEHLLPFAKPDVNEADTVQRPRFFPQIPRGPLMSPRLLQRADNLYYALLLRPNRRHPAVCVKGGDAAFVALRCRFDLSQRDGVAAARSILFRRLHTQPVAAGNVADQFV